ADESVSPGVPVQRGGKVQRVSLKGLVEDWWREAKASGRKPSTFESYRHGFQGLSAYLKHDDAARVTPADIVAYKDHRLTAPNAKTGRVASAKTVKDSDLAAFKTVFGWAVANRKLESNPALGITLKVGRAPRLRSKGFTQEEAAAILAHALAYARGGQEQAKTAAAKRWVPWLMAFTGARVGELAQLRRQDVTRHGEHWVVRITPEAGTVKTNQARAVVLHEQLVELGFPAFVQDSREGHLFLTPADDGDVLGPLQGVKNRLAEFAREAVSDPQVAPNHGWRHRFKTVGREVGIDHRTLDAIQGHAPRSDGEDYGDVTLPVIAAAIRRLPRYEVGRDAALVARRSSPVAT
ncbi:MAG TPA: tyrosine-type recombinase/integrase, partial [Salinarimonas sp.]|nr:tyrosine-type recombinase/integrase [Salinarimonas sp.]